MITGHYQWLQGGPVQHDGYLPHGVCYLWDPPLLWTHALSDLGYTIAYFIIGLGMMTTVSWFSGQSRRLVLLFGLFIFLCGMTHINALISLWEPIPHWSAVVKVVGALVSLYTAMAVGPALLKLLEDRQADAKGASQ